MNQLLLFITVLVAFVYFGGSNVPKVLKDNKQMLLGVVIGLVLPSVGVNIEGFSSKGQTVSPPPLVASRIARIG